MSRVLYIIIYREVDGSSSVKNYYSKSCPDPGVTIFKVLIVIFQFNYVSQTR